MSTKLCKKYNWFLRKIDGRTYRFFRKRYETLFQHIRHSASVRQWFAENALLGTTPRLAEYILVAPSPEIRNVFIKLIVFFCHFAINDEKLQDVQMPGDNLCEQILFCVLYLLKNEVPENGKHLTQYFTLFSMYAALGVQQKQQLLKVSKRRPPFYVIRNRNS